MQTLDYIKVIIAVFLLITELGLLTYVAWVQLAINPAVSAICLCLQSMLILSVIALTFS